jgi:hypothetical protein
LKWIEPADGGFDIRIPIDGVNFEADTKYTIKIVARGEVDGPPSEPAVFSTGDGSEKLLHTQYASNTCSQ